MKPIYLRYQNEKQETQGGKGFPSEEKLMSRSFQ